MTISMGNGVDLGNLVTAETNLVTGGSIKTLWVGTQAQYDAIVTKDANTQYNTDAGIYVGSTLVSGGGGGGAGSVYYKTPEDYGAAGNGSTDDSAAVQSAINAVAAAGGGIVLFSAKTYRIDSQITFPSTANTVPRQVPITLQGLGEYWSGQGSPLSDNKGTILDLRSSAANGKIVSYGLGLLRIEGVTLTDISGTTSNPFVYTTNTTLQIRKCSFLGSKTGVLCDQDAIVCGGTTATLDGSSNAAFQGYGTIIEGNYFNKIRRAVYGRVYFNANVISNNTVWNACGSNLASGAAFELDGGVGGMSVGNLLSGNLIEMGGYPYGIKLTKAVRTTIIGNGGYDDSPTALSVVLVTADSSDNIVHGSNALPAKPYLSDSGARTTFLCADQSEQSKFAGLRTTGPVYISDFLTFDNNLRPMRMQAATAGLGSGEVWSALRSAAEVVNPGGIIYKLDGLGGVTIGGTNAGNVLGDYITYSSNGRAWKANGAAQPSGGNMEINSGSGGSYLDLKNYAVRFYSHAGTLQATFGAAIGGFNYVDGTNDAYGTTTGTKLGTATNQKLGFWNATPIVQPASANQAAVSGTASGSYTATEQGIINNLVTLVNQLRSDLVTTGLIKGSA